MFFIKKIVSVVTMGCIFGHSFLSSCFIPHDFHGEWKVPHEPDALITIQSDRVIAHFRSAELYLKLKNVDHHYWELHEPVITKRPKTFDLRKILNGMRYLYAIEKHGVHINITLLNDTSQQLFADWKIQDSMTGSVHLLKSTYRQKP
jgi:hypothetical protein